MREGELGPRQRHSAPLYSPPPRVYCWRGLAATAPQLLGIVGILWTRSQFIRCRHLIALIALSALLSACATRYEVAQDYSELVRRDGRPTSSQTVIVFLIDGLQLGMLKEELTNGQLPALSTYFLSGQGSVHTARTVFPSLTYPAISSLLTGLPVEGHGVDGNKIVRGKYKVDFESPTDHPALNHILNGLTVFDRLRVKGMRSASFDYAFHAGASVHTKPLDLEAGVSIVNQDYNYIDSKTLESLHLLLKQTSPSQWPDFIFVHLVGVDFASHDSGPDAQGVRQILRSLDQRLAPVLKSLNHGEHNGRKVLAMLTSDHGFDQTQNKILRLEQYLERTNPGIRVLDEGRYLGLSFPVSWDESRRENLISSLSQIADVDVAALKSGARIAIRSHEHATDLYYLNGATCEKRGFLVGVHNSASGPQCVDQLSPENRALYHPYFLENVAHYFRNPGAPDAIVVAKSGVGFNANYLGQHGGPTPREVLVPLLLHGIQLSNTQFTPALWELLDSL